MSEDYPALKKFISKHISLEPDHWELFLSQWSKTASKAGEYLIRPGKTQKHMYFVTKGVQRLFFTDEKGDERILGFSFEGSISGELMSFAYETPSDLYIENITDSEFLIIDHPSWTMLFENIPGMYKWYSAFLQELLLGRLKRDIEIQSMTASERFKTFMDRAPQPLLEIPQKHLASYLNMTPETFSRMRAARIS